MTDIQNYAAEISSIYNSQLFKRFNDITITDVRIRDAFKLFLKNVECGDSVSVIDILKSVEALVNGISFKVDPGNTIYVFDGFPYDNKKLSKLLMENSICGLSSLFSQNCGVMLNLDVLGGNIATAESKRFLIANEKKTKRIIDLAGLCNFEIQSVGKTLSDKKIHLCNGNEIVSTIEKTSDNDLSPVAIKLGTEHFNDFIGGFKAVCTLKLCNMISNNNIINFGLDNSFESLVARALGYFYGVFVHKITNIRTFFSFKNDISVAVGRPKVSDGDYLYLLRVRNNENQMPDRAHFAQLCVYIAEKRRSGIIKDVLPLRENIDKVLNNLGGSAIEYVRLNNVAEANLGIIVSVPRGESLNGIELGYFKDIE